jgi:hypothetical protein
MTVGQILMLTALPRGVRFSPAKDRGLPAASMYLREFFFEPNGCLLTLIGLDANTTHRRWLYQNRTINDRPSIAPRHANIDRPHRLDP